MNKLYVLITVFSFVAALLCITSCSEEDQRKTKSITVMQDMTDPFKLSAASESDKIIGLYEIDEKVIESTGGGGIFRYKSISNVDYAQAHDYSIAAVDYQDVNRGARSKEILAYKQGIQKSITENMTVHAELRSSSIYLPLVHELEHLVKVSATDKILILYSDLNENMPDGLQSYREYRKGKEHIKERLRQMAELPDLHGLHIIFRFIPKTETENLRFRVMLSAYKDILTEKGANVSTEFN